VSLVVVFVDPVVFPCPFSFAFVLVVSLLKYHELQCGVVLLVFLCVLRVQVLVVVVFVSVLFVVFALVA